MTYNDSKINGSRGEISWSYTQYLDKTNNAYGFSQPSNMAVQEMYGFLATDMQMEHDIKDTQEDPVMVSDSSIHSSIVYASQWMCTNNTVSNHCLNLRQPGVPHAGWMYDWNHLPPPKR